MNDDPRIIAYHPGAGGAERYQAQLELSQRYMPTPSELINSGDLQQVAEELQQQELIKAAKQVIPFKNAGGQRQGGGRGMRSVYLDELQIFVQGDWFDKPVPLGFEVLRKMVEQTPVLNAVVMTRIRQVAQFCRPMESKQGRGFEVRTADRDYQVTEDDKRDIQLLTRFFSNSGWEWNPRLRTVIMRDSLPQLMAKLVRNSLTMDSCPIETEFKRDRRLGIDGYYAVDGATVRLCTDSGYQDDKKIFALQVVQGQVRTAYTHNDLIYVPRNPRADILMGGYGLGETELMVRVAPEDALHIIGSAAGPGAGILVQAG